MRLAGSIGGICSVLAGGDLRLANGDESSLLCCLSVDNFYF